MPENAAADIRNAGPQYFLDEGEAACKGVDPDLFFPSLGQDALYAKGICRRCEIVRGCRAWSLPIKGLSGVWGGLSAQDRDRWRKKDWR